MKNIFIILSLISLSAFILKASAFNTEYLFHTSGKDIQYKKNKSLTWYEKSVNGTNLFDKGINNHIAFLKQKALRWYNTNIISKPIYNKSGEREISAKKQASLTWYEKNSN